MCTMTAGVSVMVAVQKDHDQGIWRQLTMSDIPSKSVQKPAPRDSRSLFGAIVLIACGGYFLLYNLNRAPAINWPAVWPLWPLLLIFLGLNVLVIQFRRPWGTLLSGLVALAAIAAFSFAAFVPASEALLQRMDMLPDAETHVEQIAYPAAGVNAADITLDLGRQPAAVTAVQDSEQLLEGLLVIPGDVIFETSVEDGQASIKLDSRTEGFPFAGFLGGGASLQTERWEIGLNPAVPLDLRVDMASGATDLDLAALTIRKLALDGGSGAFTAVLPDGDYTAAIDMASGAATVQLAQAGNQSLTIDGASGALLIILPRGREARLELDSGSGGISLPEGLFATIMGSDPGEGVWETAGYDSAPEHIDLRIDIGSGHVLLEERGLGGR
jgi:hypothetical protein